MINVLLSIDLLSNNLWDSIGMWNTATHNDVSNFTHPWFALHFFRCFTPLPNLISLDTLDILGSFSGISSLSLHQHTIFHSRPWIIFLEYVFLFNLHTYININQIHPTRGQKSTPRRILLSRSTAGSKTWLHRGGLGTGAFVDGCI